MGLPSISEIQARVSTHTVSATEIVADCLTEIAAAQAKTNAFTLVDEERAIADARRLDRELESGAAPGPLAGVPVAVKDLIDQADRPNSRGSGFPAPVPDSDAEIVRRLRHAGAIIVGRTGLHEFAFGFSSENHWFGAVRNPWDTSLSPGGSSGGSGAAVGAGAVPAAIGTDTGGSVRVPAALCGVVGLKVTHGRVPLRGVYPLAPSLDTVGPLTRTVADAAAVYSVIAGDDPGDPWSVPRPVTPAATGRPARAQVPPTIGLPRPWLDGPLDPSVAAAFRVALDRLADAGATVVDIDIPELDPPGMIDPSVYFEVASIHRVQWATDRSGYGPEVAKRLERVFDVTADEYLAALAWRSACKGAALRAFARCDVLATPTVAATRKQIGIDTMDLDGHLVSYRAALSRFTALVNHIGLPAISLPLIAGSVPPPGLQLIGPPWSEHRLLEIGELLEDLEIAGTRTPPG